MIAEDMEGLRKGSESIRNLAGNLAVQAREIMQSSDEIASSASQAAAGTQQASSSLQQQATALDSIVRTSEDIEELADSLRQESYTIQIAEELATSAEELSATIQQSQAASRLISTSIEQIAQAAMEQATTAQRNSELLAEGEITGQQITASTEAYMDHVRSRQEQLRTIDRSTATVIEGISSMATRNIESAVVIRKLNARMAMLERGVAKLASINMLSNMLAVTGKVESARAGEHGAGFAALSADIRGLVDQSEEKIAAITTGIRTIFETIASISGEVETVGIKVRQEVENARISTARLVQVEEDMAEVTAKSMEINEVSTQARQAISDLKQAMESVTQSAEHSSTACQQASAVSRQQAQAMAALASTAEEVAAQADEL